jgi:8-oxo-dGTP pyrophosphatase MutT (NUDIX family)
VTPEQPEARPARAAPVALAADHDDLPEWFRAFAALPAGVRVEQLSRFSPPEGARPRNSAVLILLGEGERGPDVLLTERAATLRAHAGQVSFPGGGLDPQDAGPEDAALREAAEETGLDPDGVRVCGRLPDLYLPVSDYLVTPVLAWWRVPSPTSAVDPAEVARAVRVPLAELVDPAHRFQVRHPSGFVGPAFRAGGLFIWGFTAGLLSRVLELAGWERPWDTSRMEPIPEGHDGAQPGPTVRLR